MGTRFTISISDKLNDFVQEKVEELGISKSALISIALENYMKECLVVENMQHGLDLAELLKKLDEKYKLD